MNERERFRNDAAGVLAALLLSVLTAIPAHSQTSEDCLVCHGEPSLSVERGGRTMSLFVREDLLDGSAHSGLECSLCHVNLNTDEVPHSERVQPVDCVACHDDEKSRAYKESVHGSGISCSDCHGTHGVRKLSELEQAERITADIQMCATCHAEVHTEFMESDHGLALSQGLPGAPTCIGCHGEHGISSPYADTSATYRTHHAALCMGCHVDDELVRSRMGPSAGFIASYEKSVHGKGLLEGNEAAATCVDCHGSHSMKKGSSAGSMVSRGNIAGTCGECHGDIQEIFEESVHGRALARGVSASATCTDCHGEHQILSPRDADSPVAAANISVQVCSPCHTSVRLTEKYGLSADRFKTFEDSYHGLAGKAGSVEVANCASCHGVHDIRPSSDPTSKTHKSRIVETCGSCHPGANENFARGSVHVTATGGQDNILYMIATAYIVLIVVVVGAMVAHNLLDFYRRSKRRLMYRRGLLPQRQASHRLYLRMTLDERLQHGTLVVSFLLLVVTGFMLRFPNAWWVEWLENISPVVFDLRSLIHRIAGVVMVLAGLYHLYYVIFTPRGKQLIRDLFPVRSDISDLWNVIRYNIGVIEKRPQFGRFSYAEKAEYWALIWGTVIMGVTGVILWFDNTFLGLLTKLGWDIARTVHYFEAWLATLSILAWHLYFVIFNPDTYPMNAAWWKGTLTEEEMTDDHPLELQEIRRREQDIETGPEKTERHRVEVDL